MNQGLNLSLNLSLLNLNLNLSFLNLNLNLNLFYRTFTSFSIAVLTTPPLDTCTWYR
jgi:hypothetical protein